MKGIVERYLVVYCKMKIAFFVEETFIRVFKYISFNRPFFSCGPSTLAFE